MLVFSRSAKTIIKKVDVLFLYIHPSSGHQGAASAIRKAMEKVTPRLTSHGMDAFSYAYPIVGRMISRFYLEIIKHTPQLWDYLYDNEDIAEATREIRQVLNAFNASKLHRLIRYYNPQVLVCTQAVPCSVAAAEKRKKRLPLPLVAIITDFAVHAYWIYPEVDLYLVPSLEVKDDLVRRGIDPQRILVVGIPIAPEFILSEDREIACEHCHLDPEKTIILMMGGSQGLLDFESIVQDILSLRIDCQIAVVAGLNERLYERLNSQFGKLSSVKIFGYTNEIPRLMDAADILISKPGGLTSSEALAKGLPLLIINPLPGQEERNARYLVSKGAALRISTPEELCQKITWLLDHPDELNLLAQNAKNLGHPRAGLEAAQLIDRLIESPTQILTAGKEVIADLSLRRS